MRYSSSKYCNAHCEIPGFKIAPEVKVNNWNRRRTQSVWLQGLLSMLPMSQQMVSKDICTQMWSRAAYLKLKVYTAQRLDHLIITQSWTLGISSESLNRCEFISPAVVQQNVTRRHNLWRVMHLSNTSKYSDTTSGAHWCPDPAIMLQQQQLPFTSMQGSK